MNYIIKLFRAITNKSDCCGASLMYWGDAGYCDEKYGGCGKRDF
jgi:hypothetical protein